VEIALQFALSADRSPASRILADRSGSKMTFPGMPRLHIVASDLTSHILNDANTHQPVNAAILENGRSGSAEQRSFHLDVHG